MPDIAIKGTITADHKLVADVPSDIPAGEVAVIVRVNGKPRGTASAVLAGFKAAAARGAGGRTREQIDRDLED